MKISEGYILRSVAGRNIVVSVNSKATFNGMLTLNDTGMFLWELLKNDISQEEMLSKTVSEYDVDKETASTDIDDFLNNLRSKGILEEK